MMANKTDIEMLDMSDSLEGKTLCISDVAASIRDDVTKLRSAAAEMESLVRNYKETRIISEEYAMEFLCNETRHPVISCFRELNNPDFSTLIGNNKMKKSMGTLELSIIYLGLIDYMAATIDNPLYTDEKQKLIKNIPMKVQKIMVDFKSIISSWGLSDYKVFKDRYSIIMKFLNDLIPFFKGVEFDETFKKILASIDSEIMRSKQKFEFTKSTSSSPVANKPSKPSHSSSDDIGNEIIDLNSLGMDVQEISDDEEDVSRTLISWSQLKPPPSDIKGGGIRPKKNSSTSVSNPSSPSVTLKGVNKSVSDKKWKKINSNSSKTAWKNSPKKHQDTHKEKANSVKTSLNVSDKNMSKSNAKKIVDKIIPAKKPRLQEPDTKSKAIIEEVENTNNKIKGNQISSLPIPSNKPKVNAFALLMNRSKEIAQQKKQKKLLESNHNLKVPVFRET